MPSDRSGWRSTADYDYVERLGASDLAWEWLRRNKHYARDYATLSKAAPDDASLRQALLDKWGVTISRQIQSSQLQKPARSGNPRSISRWSCCKMSRRSWTTRPHRRSCPQGQPDAPKTASTIFLMPVNNAVSRFFNQTLTPIGWWRSCRSIRMVSPVSMPSTGCSHSCTAERCLSTNASPAKSDCVPNACCRLMMGARPERRSAR